MFYKSTLFDTKLIVFFSNIIKFIITNIVNYINEFFGNYDLWNKYLSSKNECYKLQHRNLILFEKNKIKKTKLNNIKLRGI